MFQLTMGCDPEIFLRKGNEFLSAFGLFEGTKVQPTPLNKGAVQVDGMALEFNIEPANNIEEFVSNITEVLSQIRKQLKDGIDFDYKSTVHLTEEYMKTRSFEELEMGCEPDYNAYTGEENTKPTIERPMRTAGGHIHVGLGMEIPDTLETRGIINKMVHLMDIFVGVPSLLIDKDDERREMYGKAGCLRYKSYGFEYRSLSNFWIQSETLMRWVYQQTEMAMNNFENYDNILAMVPDAQDVINTSNRERAREIVQMLGINIPEESCTTLQ